MLTTQSPLVVLSHLRWVFVWQRPQHLISRLARGRETWFIEEPLAVDGLTRPRLRVEDHGPVRRVYLEVPGPERHVCFSDPAAAGYAELVAAVVGEPNDLTAWLYTPMALPLAQRLAPRSLIYDVMDDLASFAGASPLLRQRQLEALDASDVVFTGGRSLQRSVAAYRPDDTHCFPSGVDAAHYAPAARMRLRRPRPAPSGSRPVAGYVGVIDERLDLELLADLAAGLPDWEIRMVGPVVKIDPSALPQAPNLTYPGQAAYADLPAVMAGFDVALMPFALNEATRSISPTKTLEYIAAGLPVVSTRVPDVVSDFGTVVDLQDGGTGFAKACRRVIGCPPDGGGLLARHHWDTIAARMATIAAGVAPVRV